MKKRLLFFCIFAIAICNFTKAQVFKGEDNAFPEYKLYYRVVDSIKREVEVIAPPNGFYSSADYPYGSVPISSKVYYDGCSYRIVGIADRAFYRFKNLKKLTLYCKHLRYIGNEAFFGCDSLSKVRMACDSLTTIGDKAFSGCNVSTILRLPASVKNVGKGAFKGVHNLYCDPMLKGAPWGADCYKPDKHGLYYSADGKTVVDADTNITHLVIPQGVTAIASGAMNRCHQLVNVVVPEGVTIIEGFTFPSSLEHIVLPSTLKEMDDYAFSGCERLQEITIPSSVEVIGDDAFKECTSLTTIEIPRSVRKIGSSFCKGCSNLKTVYYNAERAETPDHYFYKHFEGCDTLDVIFGPYVKRIPTLFFLSTIIRNIYIPSTVEEIGYAAFADCDFTAPLKIPSTVTTIDSDAFYDVVAIRYDGDASGAPWGALSIGGDYTRDGIIYSDSSMQTIIGSDMNITQAIIPEGVKTIIHEAFSRRPLLTKVMIPSSVKTIEAMAFNECPRLSEVVFSEGLKTIGADAFNKVALREVRLPNSLVKIGGGAFQNIDSLHLLVIGRSLSSFTEGRQPSVFDFSRKDSPFIKIGVIDSVIYTVEKFYDYPNDAPTFFHLCKINHLEIAEGVERIPANCFRSCGLNDVTILPSLKSIGQFAFAYNTHAEITIMGNVESINDRAFFGVRNVRDLGGHHLFDDKAGNKTYNPYGAVRYDGQMAPSMHIEGGLVIADTLHYINYRDYEEYQYDIIHSVIACDDWSTMQTASIPEGIRSISEGAFSGCPRLREVRIPQSVSRIEGHSFENCINLQSVQFPPKVKNYFKDIATEGIFHNCSSLTLYIPMYINFFPSEIFAGVKDIEFEDADRHFFDKKTGHTYMLGY